MGRRRSIGSHVWGALGGMIAVAVGGAGCASILGVDQDYVQVDDVVDGTTPPPDGEAGSSDAAGDDGVDGGADTRVGDSGAGVDGDADTGAASDASDAADTLDAFDAFDGTPYTTLGTGDLRFYYARVIGDVFYRTWSHASKTWSAPVLVTQYGAQVVPWTRPAILHSSGAEMVGVLDVTGDAGALQAIMGQPGWPVGFTAPSTGPASRTAHRGYDLAYGASTGTAIAAYADGSPSPRFRKYQGGAWSTDQAIFAAPPGITAIDWVMLVPHPRTDEITLLFTDTSQHLYGAVWNGTAWDATATTLDASGLSVPNFPAFSAAYEDASGTLLVMWTHPSTCSGAADPIHYSTKPQGSSTFAAPLTAGAIGSPGPITAASEPGSNRIVFSSEEYCCGTSGGCDDFGVGVWDGAAWAIADLDGTIGVSYGLLPGTFPVAAGWLGTTGQAVAIYSKSPVGALNWAKYTTATGWVLQTPATMTPALLQQASFAMVRIPAATAAANDDLVLLIEDTNGSVWAKLYDGTAWTDMNNGASIADNVRSNEGVPMGLVTR